MARTEARLSVSIWDDRDFLALSPTAQRMFMFLISQPDLTHDGVIALRERRWSKSAGGLSVAQVRNDLGELSTARFVVVDEDTEELLIRSFVRRDKVYRQPNVLRAAADHLAIVSSPEIHAAVAAELARIAEADDIPDGSKQVLADMMAVAEKGSPDPSPTPTPKGSPKGSDMPTPGTPGERGMVTAVRSDSPNPGPRASDPTPQRQPPAGASRAPARTHPRASEPPDDTEPGTAERIIAAWMAACAKRPLARIVNDVGRQVAAMLAEGADPLDVAEGLRLWQRKGLHPSTLPSVVNQVMNAVRDEPSNVVALRQDRRPSTTDQRVADALALADELEREARDDAG